MRCDKCRSNNMRYNGHQVRWKGGKKYKVHMALCNDCGHQQKTK